LSQKFPDFEYLVIDDGSTDETSKVVEKYGSRITYLKHANIGESRTINKGFRLSRGKFVMIVNSDDPILPGCLEKMVNALDARPDCLAAYPDWRIIDVDGKVLQDIRLFDDDIGSMLSRGHVSIGPGACFRSVCFELVGYRNPQLKYSADLDYWLRLAVAGNILHVPKVLATHRTHPSSASVTAKGRRLADETVYALYAYSKHPLLNLRQRRSSSTAMAHAHFAAIFVCHDWHDAARELARSVLASPTVALTRCFLQPVGDVLDYFKRATTWNDGEVQEPHRRRKAVVNAKKYFEAVVAAKSRVSAFRPVLRGILEHPVEMLKLVEQYGFERLIQQVKALPVWSSAGHVAGEKHNDNATLGAIEADGHMDQIKSLVDLGILYQGLGDADRSVAALRRCVEMSGGNVWAGVFQTLGVSEAQRGNYGRAVEEFRSCLIKDPGNALASYQLGSCLALQGHFAEANAIFSNNSSIACGDGRFTSSIAMRLPVPDKAVGLPFRRDVDLEWDAGRGANLADLQVLYLICCDNRYLRLFGEAVGESVARNIDLKCALHIHVVNPDADAEAFLSNLRTNLNIPLYFSKEDTDLSVFDDHQRRTYYSCARYLVLPEMLGRYKLPVLVADADILPVKTLRKLFSVLRESDVGLMKFHREGYNIMALISASVVFVNRTEAGLGFCEALVRYLSDRMQDPAALTWHLDQAALVAAHLCLSDARYHIIPTAMMLSKIYTEEEDVQFTEEVHFWSATYSIPQNAAKLDGSFFKGFLSPIEERDD